MKSVYIGVPTLEEIELYLSQMEFSLLNMRELRSDILGSHESSQCRGGRNVLMDVSNRQGGTSSHKGGGKSTGKSNKKRERKLRGITERNTAINSGYKTVKLVTRFDLFNFNSDERADVGGRSRKRKSSVKFVMSAETRSRPHNVDEVRSILKKNCKRFKELDKFSARKKSKKKVTICGRLFGNGDPFDLGFDYTIKD